MGAPVDALVAQVVRELNFAAVRQEGVQVLLKFLLGALRQRQPGALRQVPHVLVLHGRCRRTCSSQCLGRCVHRGRQYCTRKDLPQDSFPVRCATGSRMRCNRRLVCSPT